MNISQGATANVLQFIKNKLGFTAFSNYSNTASMFNAVIETGMKQNYFIESSQFENSDQTLDSKEYDLKVVTDRHVFKVMSFKNKRIAFEFFENMEFTSCNALIIERYFLNCINDYFDVCNRTYLNCNLYNNGYTCANCDSFTREILSYCEGDIIKIHCATNDIYEAECTAHLNYYINNEG